MKSPREQVGPPLVLAADIGGTSIKLGLVVADRVLRRQRIPVPDRTALKPLLEAIAAEWDTMRRAEHVQPSRVAIACSGIVDVRAKRVIATNEKYNDAIGFNLSGWAQARLGLPLDLDNDARTAAVGEWKAGAGRGVNDLAVVTLGTGIGTTAIVGGRVLRGAHGQAGILGGHLTINCDGKLCSCGNIGCVEAEASTDRLAQIVRDTATRLGVTDSPLATAETLDYRLVFDLAQQGDPLARAIRERSLRVWSAGVVNLIHAYDPARVALGGGIVGGAPEIIKVVQEYVNQHAWTPWGKVSVVAAELGDDAALIGCAHLHELDDNGPGVTKEQIS